GAAAAGRRGRHARVPGDDAELQPGHPRARHGHARRPAPARGRPGSRVVHRQRSRPI
ncbi:MAG: hypothetical protein AVDCRST_MAG04-3193, partial [uncultured Acetobacteraceae bacterium]